jgi:hypothetical protein
MLEWCKSRPYLLAHQAAINLGEGEVHLWLRSSSSFDRLLTFARRTGRPSNLPPRVEGWNYSYFARVFQINMIRVPLWKTRNNLHPSYIAKLPKNSESWRINPIYQTSEETCARSPRALNGWRLISKPNADTVRLGIQTTSKVSE